MKGTRVNKKKKKGHKKKKTKKAEKLSKAQALHKKEVAGDNAQPPVEKPITDKRLQTIVQDIANIQNTHDDSVSKLKEIQGKHKKKHHKGQVDESYLAGMEDLVLPGSALERKHDDGGTSTWN